MLKIRFVSISFENKDWFSCSVLCVLYHTSTPPTPTLQKKPPKRKRTLELLHLLFLWRFIFFNPCYNSVIDNVVITRIFHMRSMCLSPSYFHKINYSLEEQLHVNGRLESTYLSVHNFCKIIKQPYTALDILQMS